MHRGDIGTAIRWKLSKKENEMIEEILEGAENLSIRVIVFFLKLAANCVKNVNNERTSDGITNARKAMIRCGMSLSLNGKWEEDQLSSELQATVDKYRTHFNGQPVHECDIQTESETELK